MAYQGDWSTLPVDQAWDNWQSQENSNFVAGGAVVQTPNGKLERGEFGKYSGITQNQDGTYSVTRLRDDKTSDNDYETMPYRLETGPDGKQRLVQISDQWTNTTRNSGWEKNLKAAAAMGAVMAGGAVMGGAGGWLSPAAGGAGGAGAGSGAFLGEGVASGVGSWDAAAGLSAAEAVGAAAVPSAVAMPGAVEASALGEFGAQTGGVTGFGGAGVPGGIESTVGGLEAAGGAGGGGAAVASTPALEQSALARFGTAFSNLTPAQQMQLAGAVGSAVVGAAAGGSGSGGGGNDAARGVGDRLVNLGDAELQTARDRQARLDPQFQQIIDAALRSQGTNDERSAEVWKQYQDYLAPAQRRMAETAANFDTAGRRAAAGSEAVAGVDAAFDRNRQAQQRDLARTGNSLTSGRRLTLDSAQRFAQAKASAGADRVARQGIEDRGIALTQNVAAQANPTASLSLNASQLALQGGNAASNAASTGQTAYNATLNPTIDAYRSAGNTFNNVASNDLQKSRDDNAGYAGLGNLAGQLGALYFQSDPRTKKIQGKVSGKKALRSLEDAEVYEYDYKPGAGDGGRHIGRMAGKGDKRGPDGLRRISVQDELGKQHAAIRELSKQVRRLSLDDAEDAREVA